MFRNLITLAYIAWNTANLPAMERPDAILQAFTGLPSTNFKEKADLMQFIMELVRRKELLYPDNKRMVLNFKVEERTTLSL